jgi:uncharacterized Zn finger protein
MTPLFKRQPSFDLSLPCPLCGYRIQPNELIRLGSHEVKCSKCGGVFNELGSKKPLSRS